MVHATLEARHRDRFFGAARIPRIAWTMASMLQAHEDMVNRLRAVWLRVWLPVPCQRGNSMAGSPHPPRRFIHAMTGRPCRGAGRRSATLERAEGSTSSCAATAMFVALAATKVKRR
jgi:hypothetical protein